jgi:hypothetical protein
MPVVFLMDMLARGVSELYQFFFCEFRVAIRVILDLYAFSIVLAGVLHELLIPFIYRSWTELGDLNFPGSHRVFDTPDEGATFSHSTLSVQFSVYPGP